VKDIGQVNPKGLQSSIRTQQACAVETARAECTGQFNSSSIRVRVL
jgi:hypothetical protein